MNHEKQIRIMLGVILILLVIGASLLIFYQKYRYSDVFFEYNGFAIHKVEIQGIPIYKATIYVDDKPFLLGFRYNPRDLEGIKVEDGLKEKIIKKSLYVTMDPGLSSKGTIAFSEVDKVMENPSLYRLTTKPALTKEIDGNDLPKIDCDDVTADIGVIRFMIGKADRVYSDESGCVIVEAISEDNLIKVADRLMMTIGGIMDANP